MREKLIQMIQVIFCSSLLSVPGRAGAFSRDFTTTLAPECRAFSGALKIEKLKAPLIPGPEGAVDTNDWCINCRYSIYLIQFNVPFKIISLIEASKSIGGAK